MQPRQYLMATLTAICWGLVILAARPAFCEPYVIGRESRSLLEQAESLGPEAYAVHYYLGTIYRAEGNDEAAIGAWEQYLAGAPDDPKSKAVKERMTVLKLKRAEASAREAVEGDGAPAGETKENTVAVLNFSIGDDPKDAMLSKGLTAMMITDLSKVPVLTVVERDQMQALLQEIRLGRTGVVSAATAMKMGRLLLARSIVHGDLIRPAETRLRISSRIMETLNATELGATVTEGPVSDLFQMEKEIVFRILASLGLREEDLSEPVRDAVATAHTDSFEALIRYGEGLHLLDQRRISQARDAFQAATLIDPEFDLAREAFISTPETPDIDEGVDLIGLSDIETADGGGAATAASADDESRIKLSRLDVVDVAQADLDSRVAVHTQPDTPDTPETPEAPPFPEKPTVDRDTGSVRISW